jgi:hypothetical protein
MAEVQGSFMGFEGDRIGDRRGVLMHVCTQQATINGLVAYDKTQNGSLQTLAGKYESLDGKLDLVLERIPHDLHERLARVEGDNYRRTGATGMLKWVLGFTGVGSLLAAYNFLVEETSPLEEGMHAGNSGALAVAILACLVVVVGLFAYLIRKDRGNERRPE